MWKKRLTQLIVVCLVSVLMPFGVWVQPVKAELLELPKFLKFGAQKSESVAPPQALPATPTPEPELEIVDDSETNTNPFLAAEQAVPQNPLNDAFYGDLHVHTSWSPDAFAQGTRTTPQDAYTFAKGGTIDHAAGYKIGLKQPLDFYAVTDHSEYMGVLPKMLDPTNPLSKHPLAKLVTSSDPEDKSKAFLTIVGSINDPIKEFVDPAISSSVWQEIVKIADQNYQPGKFTTFPAYEWTSLGPKGYQNLHRNIIFRNSDNVPELPFSLIDSWKPEELWTYMESLRNAGADLLAIPHNPNLSDGLMFPLVDSEGNAIDKTYAERRALNEPLVEVTQIKGTSETNPLLSDTDEFADFEISDYLISGDLGAKRGQAQGSYVRDALKTGLIFEEELGVNPYKFGLIGSTDTHNSGAPVEEDAYFGKLGLEDGTPEARLLKTTAMGPVVRTWGASGLAAVWAESNTRDAIYDAFARKETFATTGPHLRVRFFGGWNFTDQDAKSTDLVKRGYEKGVPMGADLPASTDQVAPTFLLWAMKGPNSGNLDRIQVVKGWTENGQRFEKVYDVALADGRKVDPKIGEAPPVGNTVDVTKATYTNTIGDAQLAAAWTDPDFEPTQRAFYYARVLEIPTPRWSTYDALKLGIPLPADVPATIQERAYTSPIWYTPTEAQLAAGRAGALTVSNLKAQGAKALSTSDIKALIVDKRVKIRNQVTGDVLEAFYRPDGQRTLTSLAGFASLHGGLGGTTNPYSIENNMLSSSFDDGSQFSSRIYQLGDKYYGAKSDEAGYVNYVVESID